MGEQDPAHPHEMAPHYYGGQAVIEGVMMRGADTWAVAVRRPSGEIYVEQQPVSDLPRRYPIWRRPMLRGVFALGDALKVGMKALSISARESLREEEGDEGDTEALPTAAVGASMALALVVFVGLFILIPSGGLKALDRTVLGDALGDGVAFHLLESLLRIGIFLGYLWSISLVADIRRVFQYHGAEHKTIAAYEHDEVLEPATVDGYSTLHVRCGTNFLILVMVLALVVYTLAGALVRPPADAGMVVGVTYHVLLRVVLLPVVAGLAYEVLRLGAARGDNPVVRALMAPGLWLQYVTTKPPTPDQIEVAVRAFAAVVPGEEHRIPDLPSRVVVAGASPLPGPATGEAP